MPVTVIVRSGAKPNEDGRSETGPSITLDGPLIVVGRGEGCDVRLPDPSVSHRHATIRQRGNEYILVDERSTNGTFLGGMRLGAQAPRLLKQGDMARLGRVWIEFRFDRLAPSLSSPAIATRDLALQLVARALEAQGERGEPRVTVSSEGEDAGKSLCLEESGRAYVIGRGDDVDLMLADTDASRRHVQLVRRAEQLLVRDLGSKNGVDLAGQRLPTDRDCPWRSGQLLRVGRTILAYDHPAAAALAELEKSADERMQGDEEVGPPEVDSVRELGSSTHVMSPQSHVDIRERAGSPSREPPISEVGAGPIVELPRRRTPDAVQRPSKPARRHGWSSTDFLVVLLAAGVLALSVLGLIWLFRAG